MYFEFFNYLISIIYIIYADRFISLDEKFNKIENLYEPIFVFNFRNIMSLFSIGFYYILDRKLFK